MYYVNKIKDYGVISVSMELFIVRVKVVENIQNNNILIACHVHTGDRAIKK